MNKLLLGTFVLLLLPLTAQAEHKYDRGERYRDWGRRQVDRGHHKDRDGHFSFSLGFGTRGHGYDHASLRYSSGYHHHYRYPRYRERIIVEHPVYVPPSRVYIYEPAHCYTPRYYSETRYYYGR